MNKREVLDRLDEIRARLDDDSLGDSEESTYLVMNHDGPALVAALLQVMYVGEDEFPCREPDIDYQQGVIDALLRVKKIIGDALEQEGRTDG